MKGQKGYAIVYRSALAGVSLGGLLRAVWRQIRRWQQLAEQRRRLASLDDAALKDIGLSRADALFESERPFWDDPLTKRPDREESGL